MNVYRFKDVQGALPGGTTVNFFPRRLGRRAVKTDSRTLRMGAYLTAALPVPPRSTDWSNGVKDWGVMRNDTLGCCTIAAAAHAVQVFSLNTRSMVTISDDEVLAYYSRWDGYVPGNPATDNGGIELDVLNKWKQQEFAGHALTAYADTNIRNPTELKQCIWLFGGLYIGFEVPNFVMQTMPDVWDTVANDGGIDGGHAVFVTGYDDVGLTFISWGKVFKMTWAFWSRYVDEAHALLSPDFINATGLAPVGFDMLQLQDDLARIR